MKAVIIIPARLGSTRLPRKVLADVAGKPLLFHTWSRASQSRLASGVLVATDAEEVAVAVRAWGGEARLTSADLASGTERAAAVLPSLDADLVVNVQADEPLVDPLLIDRLIESGAEPGHSVVTPVYPIETLAALRNPNVVKVVRGADGRALYFSRSPVPFVRDFSEEQWLSQTTFWGHQGVYAYQRDVLLALPSLPSSELERVEKLEQLRLLSAGVRIQTVEAAPSACAVDTPEDLERARHLLGRNNG